jgi:hypothetical protein
LEVPGVGQEEQDLGWAMSPAQRMVHVGCEVHIRSDFAEGVVAIVAPDDAGLYRLTARTPLGGALFGHHVGEVVRVAVDAATVEFEILAVEPGRPRVSAEAGVAEVVDAAVLKIAPSEGPSSSLGARTTPGSTLRVEDQAGHGRSALSAIGWLLARMRGARVREGACTT